MSCARLHISGELCDSCDFGYKLDTMKDQGILTVCALRALLVGLDAETHVLIGSPSGWVNVSDWLNVSEVVLPDGISYEGLTLFASDTFDPRQF